VPVSFLTRRDRERLDRFPTEISPEGVSTYFMLSESDLGRALVQRGDHNRLGFALQLCTLRYLGFAPDNLAAAPYPAVNFVARQLGVSPNALKSYGIRAQTRRAHFQEVLAYLGFRRATEEDLQSLTDWLVTQALEHDRPTLLFQVACQRLYRGKIVRPGITRLEKIVAEARSRAERETFERLRPLFGHGAPPPA